MNSPLDLKFNRFLEMFTKEAGSILGLFLFIHSRRVVLSEFHHYNFSSLENGRREVPSNILLY